jgi:hypothetical protein
VQPRNTLILACFGNTLCNPSDVRYVGAAVAIFLIAMCSDGDLSRLLHRNRPLRSAHHRKAAMSKRSLAQPELMLCKATTALPLSMRWGSDCWDRQPRHALRLARPHPAAPRVSCRACRLSFSIGTLDARGVPAHARGWTEPAPPLVTGAMARPTEP